MVTIIKKCLQLFPTWAASKVFSAFSLLMILSWGNGLKAQVSVYSFSESLTGYTPLSVPPTTAFAAPWNDGVLAVTIPFTFSFNGAGYTSCRISTNGFVTFGTTAPAATVISPLSNATAYLGAASAMGADWTSNGTDPIVYGTEGVSPNRTFVVQWTNALRVNSPTGNYNFQIRLHETTNVVEFSYGACSTTDATIPVSTQVGLRGPSNVFASGNVINRSLASNLNWFNNTVPGTVNNSFVRTVNLAYPDLGLSYKWTPAPLCTTPTGFPTALLLTNLTQNSLGGSFTAASPAPTGYLVLRSTSNVAPTSAQVPNGTFPVIGGTMGAGYTVVSFSNALTFTETGLVPNTTYYYWIIPYNSSCTGAPYYNLTTILNSNATTCSIPTVATAASSITGNDFTANWNLVAGATNYRLDVATDAAFTSILPAYNNLSVGNVNTYLVNGLSSLTAYYYRVRAIGSSCAVNSNTIGPVNTICGFYPIPYTQNFDTTTPLGSVPACFTRIDGNSDTVQWGVQNVTSASSPNAIYIGKNATQAMNDWFFLPGLNLTGGVTYRLFFRYNTGSSASTTENLKVMLGNTPTVAAMTQTLLNLPNINNILFTPVYVDFTPVINDIYYIGYNGYSVANQSYIAVDDISVTLAPTCFEPTNLIVSAITASTATVSWTPSAVDPALGYQYYISTSATAPTAATTPTGSVGFGIYTASLSGLTSSTTYYIWVRGNCSPTDKSVWSIGETFSTECTTPAILSTVPATRCGPGSLTLTATPNATSFINWFTASTGGTPVFTGNSYVTPTINATTTYYAEAKAYGAIAKVGPSSPATHGGTIGIQNFQSSVNFNVLDDTTLQSIDIFPIASGQAGQLVLRTSSNITIATVSFTTSVSGGNVAQTIAIGRVLAPGSYNLYLGTLPASGLSMNTNNTIYPYSSTVAEITGNPIDNTQYLGFYNWKFTTQCLSGRVAVAATVTTPPALGISSTTSTICQNTSTALITLTGYAAYNSFVWTPSTGVTGTPAAGYTFNPTTTTTYTLVASQTSGGMCSNVVTHTVNVNPIPPPVTVVPASAITICQNTIQPINGSVGTFSSVPILTEDFNGATNNWTVANTSTDGDTVASQWALHASTYGYASSTWNLSVKSNDNSQFYFANADSQGSSLLPYVITNTTLTSPAFSLIGYTSATLGFYHYLRYIGGDSFKVEISTNNGGSWTMLKQYTSTQGTSTAFSHETIDISPYLVNPAVLIRFNFTSNWGYGWAMDNIAITGTVATALSWSPATGLYNDNLATDPYILGSQKAVVYAKPMTTTVYSATATGANGCLSTGTITINVDALPVGGTLSADQILCSASAPTNFTLTGSSGNVVRWEYADNAAFTINVTTIANTTTTLTPAQMGSFTTIRYFRAVLSNGVCTPVYSSVGFVSYPVTTWNGTWSNGIPTAGVKAIFTANFTAAADLHACSVIVQSGTVNFPTGKNLIVDNEVNVTGGSLVFDDSSSLIQYNSVVPNSGNIVYKRNTTPILKFDYTYWSSPVSAQSITAFSPNTNPSTFYYWNPTTNVWTFYSGNMTPGTGYIIRAPDIAPFNTSTRNIFNSTFTGVPNNGDIPTTLTLSTSDLNLIGNPYPSAISADLLLTDPANTGKLGTLYFWTHNTPISATYVYTMNDYAAYNLLGGTGTTAAVNPGINTSIPTGNIAAGEGFFAKVLQSGAIKFKNSMRLLSVNNQFFRMNGQANATPSAIEKHRLWLDVSNDQGAFRQTLVGYIDGATYNEDQAYDGAFFDSGNVVGLYSLIGSEKYAIQGRPVPFNIEDQVPLGFKSTIAGIFDITLEKFDGLFTDQNVYVEDRLTNVIHNLKESPYSFASEAGTFDTRFILRYTATTLSTPDFNVNNLVIYKNQNWIVNTGATQMQSVKVFDIRGRLLYENKAVNATQTSFNVGDVNEVLLVQVISTDGTTVTKKVVN